MMAPAGSEALDDLLRMSNFTGDNASGIRGALGCLFNGSCLAAGAWGFGVLGQQALAPAEAAQACSSLSGELVGLAPDLVWTSEDSTALIVFSGLLHEALPRLRGVAVTSVLPSMSSPSSVSGSVDSQSSVARVMAVAHGCWGQLKARDGSRCLPVETERLASSDVAQFHNQASATGTYRHFIAMRRVTTQVAKDTSSMHEVHLGNGVTVQDSTGVPEEALTGVGPALFKLWMVLEGQLAAFSFRILESGALGSLPGDAGYVFAQGETVAQRYYGVTFARDFYSRAVKASFMCTGPQLVSVIEKAQRRLIDIIGESTIHLDSATRQLVTEREAWQPESLLPSYDREERTAPRSGRQDKGGRPNNLREGKCNAWSRTGKCAVHLCPYRRSHVIGNKPKGHDTRDDRRADRRDDRFDRRDGGADRREDRREDRGESRRDEK